MNKTLHGKVAIVTGSGGKNGMGRAIANRLAKDGAKIVVTDLVESPYQDKNWNGLSSVVEEINLGGGESTKILADVTNSESIDNVIKKTIKTFGRIDILVNNAGSAAGSDRVPITELLEKDWDRVMNINLKGVFLFCKAVSKYLILQGNEGRIINISSIAGKKASETFGAYSTSKAGLIRLTETLALELAKYKITANSICPSWVQTERLDDFSLIDNKYTSFKSNLSEHQKRQLTVQGIESSIPLGRLASVDDIAGAASYLSSNEASFITGISLNVSGGIIA